MSTDPKSRRRWPAFFLRTLFACALTLVCGCCGETMPSEPFDSAKWHAHEHKTRMISDLQHSYVKPGMRREQVIELLGDPERIEGSRAFLGRGSPGDEFLNYYIDEEREYDVDLAHFFVQVGKDGKVIDTFTSGY